jgi:ABC-type multidrug transport system ATPase subunit
MIRLEGVEKRYGAKAALARLDLEIPAGRMVALLGANGAGKSTTLAIAAGQVLPDAGRVILGGHDLAKEPLAARRALSYLPQDSPLPRSLRVDETLAFFAEVRRAPGDAVAPLLALAGLEAERATRVQELSGGMRRKLAFAAALLPGPVAVVLDEPFTGLDEGVTTRFEKALRARREEGAAVLLASHDLERTVALADEVVLLEHGAVARRALASEVRAWEVRARLG